MKLNLKPTTKYIPISFVSIVDIPTSNYLTGKLEKVLIEQMYNEKKVVNKYFKNSIKQQLCTIATNFLAKINSNIGLTDIITKLTEKLREYNIEEFVSTSCDIDLQYVFYNSRRNTVQRLIRNMLLRIDNDKLYNLEQDEDYYSASIVFNRGVFYIKTNESFKIIAVFCYTTDNIATERFSKKEEFDTLLVRSDVLEDTVVYSRSVIQLLETLIFYTFRRDKEVVLCDNITKELFTTSPNRTKLIELLKKEERTEQEELEVDNLIERITMPNNDLSEYDVANNASTGGSISSIEYTVATNE